MSEIIKAIRVLNLERSIACKADILGSRISCEIGGVKCVIKFPIAIPDEKGFSHWVFTQPKNVEDWQVRDIKRYDDQQDPWGRVNRWRDQKAFSLYLNSVCIEINGSSDFLNKSCDRIQIGLMAWMKSLHQQVDLKIRCKQKNIYINKIRHDDNRFYGYSNGVKSSFSLNSETPMITIFRIPEDHYISKLELSKMIKNASRGRVPALEFRILIEAYKAFEDEDYRRAVIDAGTAIEVHLNYLISKNLARMKPDAVNCILKKLNGVKGKFDFSKELEISINASQNDINLLSSARNPGVHGGRSPDKVTAKKVITIAEKILDVTQGPRMELAP